MYRVLVCTLLLILGLAPASARNSGENLTKQKQQQIQTTRRVALADTKTEPKPLALKQGGPRPSIRAAAPPTIKFPTRYAKGTIINGLDVAQSPDTKVFHAGTAQDGDSIVTSGGRVLCGALGFAEPCWRG